MEISLFKIKTTNKPTKSKTSINLQYSSGALISETIHAENRRKPLTLHFWTKTSKQKFSLNYNCYDTPNAEKSTLLQKMNFYFDAKGILDLKLFILANPKFHIVC